MFARLLAHLRGHWMGALALFLALIGGVAYTANAMFSEDIAYSRNPAASRASVRSL